MAEPLMNADGLRCGPISVRPRLVGIVPPIRMQDDLQDCNRLKSHATTKTVRISNIPDMPAGFVNPR